MGERREGDNYLRERFGVGQEARIGSEKVKNTRDNAVDLLKSADDFFGGDDEGKASEIALRVLGRYGRSKVYRSFDDILDSCRNPAANRKVAEADRDSVVDAVLIAMDISSLGEGLVTDDLKVTAEVIDEFLPKEMKGVGKLIKERSISTDEREMLVGINGVISGNGLFDSASDEFRGRYYEEWGRKRDEVESPLVKIYLDVCRGKIKDIGIKERGLPEVHEERRPERREELPEVHEERRGRERVDLERPNEVLKYARSLLDVLEHKTFKSTDISISDVFRPIGNLMTSIELKLEDSDVDDEPYNGEILTLSDVYNEISARLALHDTAYYMEDSGYKILERGGMTEAAARTCSDYRELDRNRLRYLLRMSGDKKFGLPIAGGWNLLEEANFDYLGFLTRVADDVGMVGDERDRFLDIELVNPVYARGTTIEGKYTSYFMDSDDIRKSKVDKYIVRQISKDGYDAKKALELAKKLISASAERCVFNFGLINGDNFSEAIHFAYYKRDDARKGKKVGAESNKYKVQSLTPGWFRVLSGKPYIGVLRAEDIDVENCKEKNTFSYYFTQIVDSKVNAVKRVFTDTAPTPKAVLESTTYFNDFVDGLSKLDPLMDIVDMPGKGYLRINSKKVEGKRVYYVDGFPGDRIRSIKKDKVKDVFVVTMTDGGVVESKKSREGEKHLRSYYVLGLLELIAIKPDLGWTSADIVRLRRNLVDTPLTSESPPFMSDKMWDWVNDQIVANNGRRKYNFSQAFSRTRGSKRLESMRESFWSALAGRNGGGKKKRG